jgi:hypothetical protein
MWFDVAHGKRGCVPKSPWEFYCTLWYLGTLV